MADGFSLNVDPKFLQNLEEADKRIQKIADTMEATSKRIIKSFQDINSQGLDVFVNKMNDVNKVISSLSDKKISISNILGGKSQTAKSVDDINKLIELLNKLSQETKKTQGANKRGGLFGDMSKSVSDWQALQKQISDNEKQISKLTQSTREYESTMKRIQSGKGGVIHGGASKEYQENIKNIETLRQQNASLQQKQQLIIQNNQALQAQANLQHQLKQYNQQQGSLPEQRKADELKRMNDYYRELEKSSKRASEESIKSSEKEAKARERAERASKKQAETEAKRQQRAAQSRETQILNAYNQAMKANEATVNQRINKLAKLRQVESQLAQDEAKYSSQLSRVRSEIDRLSQANDKAAKSTKQLQSNQRNLMDTTGQLQRKLALLFSVSAIQGYISKLIDVRGEFEMQQRSLQVLLQNKDQANELWDKTVALAVKSPFRVKELVTYTKQLAAYRVEADKLFETNKMLADVSAGLGVDMNRLILAFGQVKAANYLRGTELRQFSEAGVNMLGELAQYFTELEGRAVSVGDVFERVSKRMVTFQDVNAIFQRITSESGIFYQMQEKQSETLRGMVMNFRDSMDLMLNDIGKSQDSILKDSIRLAKEFIDNWRDFSTIINTAGVVFLAAFGTKSLLGIAKGLRNLFAFISANPWIALAGAVALVVTYLYQAADAQNKLNAAMQEVDNENIATLEENISLYHKLVGTINDATKSYEDRNKALSQLKQKFNDILPDQYTELEYVQRLGDNYRDAEDAMMDYYNAKAKAQKKTRLDQEYSGEIEGTDIPELIASTKDWIEDMYEIGDLSKDAQIRLNAGVNGVINNLVDDVKNGKISANIDIFKNELKTRLEDFSGVDLSALWNKTYLGFDFRGVDISDILGTLQEYQSAIQSIEGLPYETYDQLKASEIINKEKLNIEKATSAFKKAASLYEQYANAIPKVDKSVKQQREEIEKDVQKILTDLPESLNAYSEYLKGVFSQLKENADSGKFNFKASLQAIESDLYALRDESGKLTGGLAKIAFDNVVLNETANDAAKQMIKNFQEGLDEQGRKLKMSTFQKSVNEGIKEIADRFDVSADVFAKFVPTTTDALSTVRQNVKAEIDSMESRLKEFQNSLTQGMYVLSEGVLNETKKSIEEITKLLPAFKSLFAFLGGDLDKGSGRSNSLYDERIKVIDDMNKKYKELNKTLEKSKALQGAFDAYIDAFATAYEGINWVPDNVRSMSPQEFASKVLNFPNENDLVNFLDRLSKEPMKTFEKIKVELAKGEYVYDMKVRVKSEEDKDLLEQIEDMFSGYEMSIELQKMNIPPDLAKQLFNIDSLTLPDLKNKLIELKPKFEGEEMLEEWDKLMKKIEDKEDKEQEERLKKYTKYLLKAQSERVRIKLDEMRQLAEIDKEDKYSQDQKETIKRSLRIETQEKLDKEAWDEFKNSEMYTQMFEDLETLGNKAIDNLLDNLEKLKDSLKNLPANEVKEIMTQINKLSDIKNERNPFASLRDAMKEVRALEEQGKTEESLQLELQAANARAKSAQNDIDAIDTIINAKREGLSLDSQSIEWQNKYGRYVGLTVDMLEEEKRELGEIVDHNQNISEQSNKGLSSYAKARNALRAVHSEWESIRNMATKAYDSIKTILESMGVEADSTAMVLADMGMSLVDLVFQAISFGVQLKIMTVQAELLGVAINSALGPIGWAVLALQAIATVFSGIVGLGDAKKERQIKKEQELVENLEKAYKKLEKAIENAYSISNLEDSGKKAQHNIQAQIKAYERMIALEEDKKKTDKDKINDWKNTIDELREQAEELNKEVVSTATAGIMDIVLSASEEFTDAWLEAFKETGDGLSGLESNFKETMLEMVKQQAAMLISQAYVDRWKKQLEQYINPSDLELSTDEARKWVNAVSTSLPQLNDALEKYFTAMQQAGVDISGSGELSGLQRGIQEIQESTAQEIAAYLNSIRFFVAEQNTYLSQIASSFSNTEIENPMVSQLKIIASQTTAINELLNSLTSGGHSMGGRGFRVFIS